jgi:hypothetical protein
VRMQPLRILLKSLEIKGKNVNTKRNPKQDLLTLQAHRTPHSQSLSRNPQNRSARSRTGRRPPTRATARLGRTWGQCRSGCCSSRQRPAHRGNFDVQHTQNTLNFKNMSFQFQHRNIVPPCLHSASCLMRGGGLGTDLEDGQEALTGGRRGLKGGEIIHTCWRIFPLAATCTAELPSNTGSVLYEVGMGPVSWLLVTLNTRSALFAPPDRAGRGPLRRLFPPAKMMSCGWVRRLRGMGPEMKLLRMLMEIRFGVFQTWGSLPVRLLYWSLQWETGPLSACVNGLCN